MGLAETQRPAHRAPPLVARGLSRLRRPYFNWAERQNAALP